MLLGLMFLIEKFLLCTFFDSLTKDKDKLIQMGSLSSSKGKDHALKVQGSKNTKSKEKQIVKEKKPKSEIEDESSKPTDEDSVKKVNKKEITSKCSYCSKGFHPNNKCFKKNMGIMSHLLEKNNIEVLDEPEKSADSSEHYHSVQFQGDKNYSLSARLK